jgi:tetratricopeptide (TPR) repeat protein
LWHTGPVSSRSALALSLAAVLALFAPGRAAADLTAVHAEVLQGTAAVRAARGPEAYAALRELWRMWDRVDPAQVEAALESMRDAAPTASTRVYAELLSAYSRRRRGDLEGALSRVDKLGFIGKWLTVGPFENDNKSGFVREFGPEEELGEPISAARTYDGKERAVRWRAPPAGAQYGWFDFGDLMRPREKICGYATTFVRAKAGGRAPRPMTVWVGSAGAIQVFWNSDLVIEDAAYRELDIDRVAAAVTLRPGDNRITVKVCGADEPPKFALRLGNAEGAPDLDIEVSTEVPGIAQPSAPSSAAKPDEPAKPAAGNQAAPPKPTDKQAAKPVASTKADPGKPKPDAAKPKPDAAKPGAKVSAKTHPDKPVKRAPLPPGKVLGPIQQFDRAVAGANPPPAMLEAYARYLAVTGGDPQGEHKARDLAARAAEAAPTVRRLLLAGDLAEDRNQRREWIRRAAEQAGPRANHLEVLLAQAHLERTGPNWRDAVPIFDRILAIDPDHVHGILGRVELYVEAGLKRTALHTLEASVRRQPSSVALLRAYSMQLRAIGRDTEAAEVEARYAALRFDDSGWLSQQVELAVARRDKPGAERWLSRFLRSEPESAWARGVAARTYRALGQPERAVAAYQRALEMAPEDTTALRALADIHGEQGRRDEQLKLLRQILAISPQNKDVREYVEHIQPPKPRADEAYAWGPDRFLPSRAPSGESARYARRTLRNLTVTTVFENGLASRFRQVVFQPLNDEAAAAGREYAFEYSADKQVVQLRAARVYRADGKIDEAIESGEAPANNPAIAMYTSQRTFYVHFPRLSTGDVVELRYRIEDVAPRNEIADYFGEVEYLSSDEPIASSEYVLITPKKRKFFVRASPMPRLKSDVKENADQRIYRWAATDVAPVSPEPHMPPWPEVLAQVHVSTFQTWDAVGSWYWGLAREQFDVDDEVRKKTRDIVKGLTDERAKVRAVYKYATQLRYVALEFGIEGIRPRRSALTLARGWGDCKDKATLIVTMLRELGIPSTIVLLRTGMRGDIAGEPASLAPFDHAIAYVPSLDLYLDGTAEHTGSAELPAMDRRALGLQINEGKPKLVRLPDPPPEESAVRRKVEVTLAGDGSAQLGIDVQLAGVWAVEGRNRYMADASRRDRVARDLSPDFGPLEIAPGKAGIEVNDLEDVEQPVRVRTKAKALSFGRREGDRLSVPVGAGAKLVAEYASLSNRTLDVVLPALTSRDDEWTLRIPAGMKVVHAPAPEQVDTPFGRYSISVEQSAGKVVVKTSLAFKKSRIKPAEYAAWRAFCERGDRALMQRLVVGK